MKILLLNNEFRVYWKARLVFLQKYLSALNNEVSAIELFGKGSPYTFDKYNNQEKWWNCLFPGNEAGELPDTEIKKQLFLALDKANPDVIIAPSIVFYAGALGIQWAKKNKKKFIMFDDAKPSQFKRNFLVQWVKDIITGQSDALWLPSDDFDAEYSMFKKKGIYFFYGFSCIDNNFFKQTKINLFDNKNIICVSRLVPKKNIGTLLKAWEQVEKAAPHYKLSIIGAGPEKDDLIKLSKSLGLKNVEFLGVINNGDLPVFYSDADAFIFPSLTEPWGLVVNEAMAAGLPVLLSRKVNACQSLLVEGANGYSFDPTSPIEMADVIVKYINSDSVIKKRMSAKTLEIIDNMSYEKMGLQLTEALEKIKIKKFKNPPLLARLIISLWNGRYDTSSWDKSN
jgi:glycosyltransferase involved in cell wall biosynthesis